MIHRSLRLAIALSLVFSFGLAFFLLRSMDEQLPISSGFFSGQYILQVDDAKDVPPASEVYQALSARATELRVNIFRDIPLISNSTYGRDLYLEVGNPSEPTADWLRKGYPQFSSASSTQVHPFADLGSTDARGFYHVIGSRASAESIRQTFIDRGFTVEELQYFKLLESYTYFGSDALVLGFTVMLCVVLLLTASGVILSAKKYAIARLHGTARATQLLADMRHLAVFGAACCAVVVSVVAVLLAVSSGTHQLRPYLSVSAFLWLMFSGVGVLAYLLALTLVQLLPLLAAIKGELSGRAILVVSYLGKTLALLVALSVLATVFTSQQSLSASRFSQATWQKTAGHVSFELSGTIGHAESARSAEPIGSWLAAEDRAGRLIFCRRMNGNEVLPTREPRNPSADRPLADPMLMVNSTYLKFHPILDAAGRPIGADSHKVRVFLSARARLARSGAAGGHRKEFFLATFLDHDGGELFPAGHRIQSAC